MPSSDQKEQNKSGGIQVIARAMKIMHTLKNYPNGLSLGQISQQVGLARSTVQRIVLELEKEGFIVHASPNGGFRLGPGLAILAASVRFDLRQEIRPFLQQLSAEVDETVDFSVMDHGKFFYIDQITAPQRLQAVSALGITPPMHCTANGKAVLAALPVEEVESMLPKKLTSYTPNTIVSRDALMKELEQIRSTRIAYDREEHSEGICAVGVAIRDMKGNLSAISIPLPSSRFYGNEERLANALLETRQKIEQHMFMTGSP